MFDIIIKYWPFFAALFGLLLLAIYVLHNYFAAKEFEKRTNQIIKRVKVIYKIPIKHKLENLEKMAKFSDDYKKGYEIWSRKYKNIIEDELTGVSKWLEEIKTARQERDYHKAKSLIVELLPKLEVLELKVNSLNEELENSREIEKLQRKELEKNRERWVTIKNVYKKEKPLLEKFIEYFDTIVESVEAEFKRCDLSIKNGLNDNARKTISIIEDKIIEFGKAIEVIPNLDVLCSQVIPSNLDKLIEKKKDGINHGIGFANLKIDKTVEDIKKDCKRAIKMVEEKRIPEAIDLCNQLNIEQKNLTKKVEAEFSAAEAIKEFYPIVRAEYNSLIESMVNIEPIIRDAVDAARLSQSDLEIVAELKGSMTTVKTRSMKLDKAMINQLKFSQVELLQGIEALRKSIIKTSTVISKQVSVLKTASIQTKRASETIKEQYLALVQLENIVATTKFEMKKASILNDISKVKAKLDHIVKELKDDKIETSSLNRDITMTSSEIANVDQTINNFIKTAKLAEKAIVIANSYSNSDARISKAITKSELLFSSGDYESSLSCLVKLFEKMKPDFFERLYGGKY